LLQTNVMMNTKFFFLALLSVVFIGCSSDDSDNPDDSASISNHFPLNTDNSWTYNNQTTNQNGNSTSSQETITVASSSEMQGVTYYTLASDASPMEQGFVTGLLTNGELTAAESQLIFDGEYNIPLSDLGLAGAENLSIPLANIILYDIDANTGDILTENDNQLTQNLPVPGIGEFPFTFEYTITSTQSDFLESYTVGEETYNDVISATVVLELEVHTNVGVNITVLAPQDAIQITNYYANNVGLIYSNTDVHYQFEDINLPTFPVIDDIQFNYTQELDSYIVIE